MSFKAVLWVQFSDSDPLQLSLLLAAVKIVKIYFPSSHLHKFIFTTEIFIWCTGGWVWKKSWFNFFCVVLEWWKIRYFFHMMTKIITITPCYSSLCTHTSHRFHFRHVNHNEDGNPPSYAFNRRCCRCYQREVSLWIWYICCVFYVASRHLLFTTLQFLFAEFDTFPLVTMKCELEVGDGEADVYMTMIIMLIMMRKDWRGCFWRCIILQYSKMFTWKGETIAWAAEHYQQQQQVDPITFKKY